MRIYYDNVLNCYILSYQNELICLGSYDLESAQIEAQSVIDSMQ